VRKFQEKLGQKGASTTISAMMPKLEFFGHIFVADTMGLALQLQLV